jgi:hypothetical protein
MSRRIPIALLLALASLGARADELPTVVVSTGQLGMRKEIPHALAIDVQLRGPWQWTLVRPVAGVLTSSKGGAYLYSGVVADIPLGGGVLLSPGFAPGVVLAKADRDLGYPIEFRSSIDLSASIRSVRMGLSFSHISNARLGSHNPGVEILAFTLSLPRGR